FWIVQSCLNQPVVALAVADVFHRLSFWRECINGFGRAFLCRMLRQPGLQVTSGDQQPDDEGDQPRGQKQKSPLPRDHARSIIIENHLNPPFEYLFVGNEGQLMFAVKRRISADAALRDFENALRVSGGARAEADDAVVTGHLALQTHLTACVAYQRVEKENDLQGCLKEIDERIAARDMRQFMLNDRRSLGGRRPVDDVGRQQNGRSKYACQKRR